MPKPKTLNYKILQEYAETREAWLIKNIHVDLTASPFTTATCKVCKKWIELPSTDDFAGKSLMVGTGMRQRTKHFKTNKQYLAWFQGEHWDNCEKTHDAYFDMQCKMLGKK